MGLVVACSCWYGPRARRSAGTGGRTGLDKGLSLRVGKPEPQATAGLPGHPKAKGSLAWSRLPSRPLYLSPSIPIGIVEEGDIVLRSAEPDQSLFERPLTAYRPRNSPK